jgi:hypothetical protein
MKKRIDENHELNGEQAAEEPIAGALGKSSVVRLGLRRSGIDPAAPEMWCWTSLVTKVSLLATPLGGAACVLTFEPNADNVRLLRSNLEANVFANRIKVVQAAFYSPFRRCC